MHRNTGMVSPTAAEREADRTRLHTALGLDIDAHLDLLADAAVALRAENERLKLENSGLEVKASIGFRFAEAAHQGLKAFEEDCHTKDARIAQLEAALGEAVELLHPSLREDFTAALLAGEEK